jgi:GNAT superfamily N-acetyltransferase
MATSQWTLTVGSVADATDIAQLSQAELGRAPLVTRIEYNLERWPSILARANEELIGFVFTVSFAPDIYEVANMLVAERLRSAGIGTAMMTALEERLAPDVRALILSNSSLWGMAGGEKRSAEAFYARHGFRSIFRTDASVVMVKRLSRLD